MAGVQPVDELVAEINYYTQSLRQRNSETIKEHIHREELVWNRLCVAVRALDGSETMTDVVPLH
eukprot:5341939-Lingulodinium_polyedra.AAC.1